MQDIYDAIQAEVRRTRGRNNKYEIAQQRETSERARCLLSRLSLIRVNQQPRA